MPNRNYQIGYRFERRVINYLIKKGYYCIRSYASHGTYDLLAIPPKTKEDWHNYPLMIQAKSNNYVKPKEREWLEKVKDSWQGLQLIAFKDEKRHIKFRTLKGDIIIV